MQRNIRFMLNGRPVEVQVGNHQNLVEVLQGQGLFGARESCALCGPRASISALEELCYTAVDTCHDGPITRGVQT